MNNIELEQKILEIIGQDNYFDMVIMANEFEPEYKKSDFYKQTKKPLKEVIKEAKIYYTLQLRDLGNHLQQLINGLSVEKLSMVLDQMGTLFTQENNDIMNSLEVFKDLQD